MKKIIALLSLSFFLFLAKGNAQATYKITLANDTCLFKNFNIGYTILDSETISATNTYTALSSGTIDVPNGKYLHLDFKYKNPTDENINPLNGVSTLDMVLTMKHILGSQPIPSATALLAADVTNNGKISVMDLVELGDMILGISPSFSNNKSWRIYSGNKNALLKDNKFNILVKKDELLSFRKVKIGDINGNADMTLNGAGCF
jgi:hypothetical protein